MKKILVITEHPAPYWSKTLYEINKYSNASAIYIKEKVSSKPWVNQKYFTGITYNLKNSLIILKRIIGADQIILGGIYLKELRMLFLISILFNKKIALFSDVPKIRKRSKILIFLKKQIFKRFNFLLVSGNKGIEVYHKLYNIKLNKIIYFPYAWNEDEVIEVNFNDRPLRVFISNRFLERKGYEIFLKAILDLKKRGVLQRFNFIIAGNGPLYEYYENKFKQIEKFNFTLKGWIEYDEYVEELNKCHIFIHTSLFEPFGIPVLDALYRGKIVISSDAVMSAIDFIINEKNGFLYSSLNFVELANTLKNISQNHYNLNSISERAINDLNKFSNYIQDFNQKINL